MKLNVKYSQSVTRHDLYAYALKLVATPCTDGDDAHIFIFHRHTPEMPSGRVIDEFINVADPVDMFEIPQDEPNLEAQMPYYRSDTITLWFRCMDDLQLAKKDLDNDINTLCKTFDFLAKDDEFTNTEKRTYGQ